MTSPILRPHALRLALALAPISILAVGCDADSPDSPEVELRAELDTLDPATVELCLSEDDEVWCWTPEDRDALELALIDLIPEQPELRVCIVESELSCCWDGEALGPVDERGCAVPLPSVGLYITITPVAPTNSGSSSPQRPIIDDYASREEPSAPVEPVDDKVDVSG